MRKVAEYLEHAQQCRQMARTALPEHRQQYEDMAVTWEQLAENRQKQLKQEGTSDEI